MSDKMTDAEILADLDAAIARFENADSGWACVDAMKAARSRIAAAPDLLAALVALRSATPGTATQKAARRQADAAIAKATQS
jgi:hypothetical protein